MSEQSWWRRVVAAVNREYDRRIRRASLVTEYGADHHGHAHAGDGHGVGPGHSEPDHDDDGAEIVNLPKGTPLSRPARATTDRNPEQPSA